MNDELPRLVDHLKKFTDSTSVYIGKLVQPKKPIKDDDDETAHYDRESDKQILFQYATQETSFIVDKVLKQEQGLTFDVFKDKEPTQQEEEQQEEGDAE